MTPKSKAPYSIGVVTYHARFDEYLKPLITNLARIFPDREIICVLNGHPEQTLQIRYLDKATEFLSQFPNVRYLAQATFQPLTRSWNQLIILSRTEKIAIISDDVFVGDLFREELDQCIDNHDTLFLLNRTWCHFVTTKTTVRKVGWFEERFPGIGWEDNDYMFRMKMAGVPCPSEKVLGILNLSTDNDNNPGWENPKGREMKYTSANEDYFQSKWWAEKYDGEEISYTHDSSGPYGRFALKPGMDTPLFYDLSVLDNDQKTSTSSYKTDKLRYLANKLFFVTLDSILTTLRRTKRFIKKIREAKAPV